MRSARQKHARRHHSSIPLRSLLLTLAIVLTGCGRDNSQQLVASAKEFLDKGDANASIIQLKNALQKNPDNSEARYLMGLSLIKTGEPASAEIELNKAIALGLGSDELQLALARAVLNQGAAEKVVTQFASKKLSSPPKQAELRAIVGTAQLIQNHQANARTSFTEALELDPLNVTANLGMARLAASEQDFAKALRLVDASLGTSPSSVEALILKADLLAAQGQSDAAEKAYRDAIQVAPRQIVPRLNLIAYLVKVRSADKASSEVEALVKIAPKDPRTSYSKAMVLVGQRKFSEARAPILQVLKVSPEHLPTLLLAGIVAFETGAYPEAESYLRKVTNQEPGALFPKRLLAATHLRLGQVKRALSEIQELLEKAGKDPNIVALAGEIYLANGDVTTAAHYYDQAKSLLPENSAVRTRLAQIRFAAGDSARAISELESASADNPNEHQADFYLVAIYLRQRQADKALEVLKNLEKKQPDNPSIYNLRGLAQIQTRDFAAARSSFERALQLQPTNMQAVASLASLDLREKNADAAKNRYESLVKKEPNNEQALLGLAALLRITGATEPEIEKLIRQSVIGNPTSPTARLALYNFYIRNRDFRGALSAAQDAQAALPNNPSIVEALGMAQLAAGETQQALSTFARLVGMQPESAQALLRQAQAYMVAKQPNDAIQSARKALALRADLPLVQRDIAAIYATTGRGEDAIQEAKAIQVRYPKEPLGYVLEGDIYAAQKKWSDAERSYRNAMKKFDLPLLVTRIHAVIDAGGRRTDADSLAESWTKTHPKDAIVLTYLADRDLAAKRYESAARRYRIALERQPDNPMLLNNLGWTINELKQPNGLEYAERAHELEPENTAIMDTLGWILVERGQIDRGLELLGRATELAPNAYEIRLHLAKSLIKADRKSAARKELEFLSKLDSRLPIQQESSALLSAL
jgi:putative PEP-CTERM system TPR-repeat lipoprotein